MRLYKRHNEANILRAMTKVFHHYNVEARVPWLPRYVIISFIIHRHFYVSDVNTFDPLRIKIGKVLDRQVKAGKVQSRRGKGYRQVNL